MTGTAWLRSTHRRCFSCCIWYAFGKPGELKQIVNNSSYTDCGRDRRDEYSSFTDCGRDHRVEEEIVNIPVSQIVEEIAEVSKSSIVWRSIPNLYFEEIKVFPG